MVIGFFENNRFEENSLTMASTPTGGLPRGFTARQSPGGLCLPLYISPENPQLFGIS